MSASRNPIPEQHVPFDLSAYLCAPHLLREAETGAKPSGSMYCDGKIVVLWSGDMCAKTYVASGLRQLRPAVVNQTEDSNAI